MAVKLHLATFLHEIRCHQLIADRQPDRPEIGALEQLMRPTTDCLVGLRRRRLAVEFAGDEGRPRECSVVISRPAPAEGLAAGGPAEDAVGHRSAGVTTPARRPQNRR